MRENTSDMAFKFVPERSCENPIPPPLLNRKKLINEELRTLERLVRIEACTTLYTALKKTIETPSSDYLLPVTIIQKESDDEALMQMLLPELCKKFHPSLNIVILTGTNGPLIKRFQAQADFSLENLVFMNGAHLPHPQEVSDFMSFLLEQPFKCHLLLDDATPLIYAPILQRERLVLQKIEYPSLESLVSTLLQQV